MEWNRSYMPSMASSVKEKYWLTKNMKNVINSIIMMFPLHFIVYAFITFVSWERVSSMWSEGEQGKLLDNSIKEVDENLLGDLNLLSL